MEYVSDYPRPPAVEPCERRIRVEKDGHVIADSTRGLRVLETTHPPGIYVPPEDVRTELLAPSPRRTFCEYKGRASYYDVLGEPAAAWCYPDPTPLYAMLRGFVSFYPGRMDACWLDDERVTPEDGEFYGGWITRDIALG